MQRSRSVPVVLLLAALVLFLCLCLALMLGAVLLFGERSGAPDVSGRVEQRFIVTGVPSVAIENAVGSVFVRPGAPGHVEFYATRRVRAQDSNAARTALGATQVGVDREGEQIRISVITPGEVNGKRPAGSPQVSVDFELVVPPQSDISIRLGAGNINLHGLQGTLGVSTRAGEISIVDHKVTGGLVIRSQAGNITFTGHLAEEAEHVLLTGVGDIRVELPSSSAFLLEGQTGAGHIQSDFPLSGGSPGPIVSASVGQNPTARLQLTTRAGNIYIQRGTP